jgi:hypothetical protein
MVFTFKRIVESGSGSFSVLGRHGGNGIESEELGVSQCSAIGSEIGECVGRDCYSIRFYHFMLVSFK